MQIPKGNSKEDNTARKTIIKGYYTKWIAKNPEKKVWNKALNAYIYVKNKSVNETSGQASISYESTREVLRLTHILANASIHKVMPPKKNDKNQKPYSSMLIMYYKTAMLVVGKQRTTGEYVQYCISRKRHKK